MHIVGVLTFDPNMLLTLKSLILNPQCNITVMYWALSTKCLHVNVRIVIFNLLPI